jgi:AcrR family transcriptional regulator
MLGVLETVGRLTYAKSSVDEVLARSGVDRESFDALFGDLQSCFLAASGAAFDCALAVVDDALEAVADWPWLTRVSTLVTAFVDCASTNPDAARACLTETRAAGEEACRVRDRALDGLASRVLRGAPPPTRAIDAEFAAYFVVGAMALSLAQRLGRPDALELLSHQMVEAFAGVFTPRRI